MTTPDYSKRLSALRREISIAGFDGFLVPRTDDYLGEYIPPNAERVAFLSGFTGSAATIVVLKDKAALFTDGRYILQVARQVARDNFSLFDTAEKTPLAWLEENISKGEKIAYDPWLHSIESVTHLKAALTRIGAEAVPVARNLVDVIWDDQPAPSVAPVFVHDLSYVGKSSAEKRREIAAFLNRKNVAAAFIADPTSVAWLLNVRGGDVPHTPLPLSHAILREDGSAEWFVSSGKITEPLTHRLGWGVTILSPDELPSALKRLAQSGKTVLVDPMHTPSWIADCLSSAEGRIEQGEDPCALPRSIKNAVELEGMRAAHIRDGAALTSFLAWLDTYWEKEQVTEIDAARNLEAFREANIHYCGPSFDTISATGEHGAMVHYGVTKESNARLSSGQLYLLDSGAQYLDGTTDVTRTIALGSPSAEMCENFTRVLKGHIALAMIRFPEGTTGADLDVLARQHLWAVGRDYSHGTGHGVGCYLGVHEGPPGISKRNKTPLKPGMVLSNEPGFYKEGRYGIRIENLFAVVEIVGMAEGRGKTLGFDVLTLAPIDRRLIDVSMLTEAEYAWLNAYHRRVQKTLRPLIDETTAAWLETATKDIEK
ncbi:MAG: aminopeptidase P family protein [Bdellovibrionales bacterium]|jgi:Xaa-Pro aminopeptidase